MHTRSHLPAADARLTSHALAPVAIAARSAARLWLPTGIERYGMAGQGLVNMNRSERIVRIAIMGAGAIGSATGGMLARAGHRVTLIGREPHIREISNIGLHITGIWGEHAVTRHRETACMLA